MVPEVGKMCFQGHCWGSLEEGAYGVIWLLNHTLPLLLVWESTTLRFRACPRQELGSP